MTTTEYTWAMCPPEHFAIEYEINPWMRGNIGQSHHALAVQQWESLYKIVTTHSTVQLIPAMPKLPDMCFTANAGLISKDIFIPSHFKVVERQGEEVPFTTWFRDQGYHIAQLPSGVHFEGEGDALFQPDEPVLWIGHGMRTEIASHALVGDIFSTAVHSLHLVDPYYYHLDTCFVPLPGKKAVYYPHAFDEASLQKLRDYFAPEARYEVEAEDASNFVCNAILCGNKFICNQASLAFHEKLNTWGFEVISTPLSEFMLAGGAAKCLALRL